MRILLLLLVVVAGALAAVEGALPCDVAAVSPDCYVALRPGPTRDVLEIVEVDDAEVSESAGELVLTTVAVDQSLEIEDLVALRGDPTVDRGERELYFPPDVDEDVTREFYAGLMQQSEWAASIAALDELGYELPPDGARVFEVLQDGPSDGALQPGDVVTAVDGETVTTSEEFAELVGGLDPGTEVRLTVRTAEGTDERTVVLGEFPDEPGRGYVGLSVGTDVELPVDLEFDVGTIGGPSAGLMFALSIVDLLSEEDLTGGRVVAGTGEITEDGRVGPISGIRQKLPGAVQRPSDGDAEAASVFLLPRANVPEARTAVPGSDLLLVPVDTLGDALDALRTLRDGGQPEDSFTLPAGGLLSAAGG